MRRDLQEPEPKCYPGQQDKEKTPAPQLEAVRLHQAKCL